MKWHDTLALARGMVRELRVKRTVSPRQTQRFSTLRPSDAIGMYEAHRPFVLN